MFVIVAKDVPFNPIVTSIPNEFIKKMIQLLEICFRNVHAKNFKKIKKLGQHKRFNNSNFTNNRQIPVSPAFKGLLNLTKFWDKIELIKRIKIQRKINT